MARSRPVVDMARRMKMANLIRQKRLKAGLEQAELAEMIGVTPAAVGNWERCIARPDFDTVPKLCSVLRISATELLNMEPEMGLSGEERDVVTSYRKMSSANKRMVRTLISELEQNEIEQRYEHLRHLTYRMPALLSASAGFGATMDDELPTEQLYVRNNPCQQKSTVLVKVNGKSMEPVYMDGSFVYVDEKRTPRIGDDVVVIYEDTLYIKQFTPNGLESYNADKDTYPLIKVQGWQDVKCLGVVMGRVNEYDILTGQELKEVEQAYAEIEE